MEVGNSNLGKVLFWFDGILIRWAEKSQWGKIWFSSFFEKCFFFVFSFFPKSFEKKFREMKQKSSQKLFQVRILFYIYNRPEAPTLIVRIVHFQKLTRNRFEIANFYFWPSNLDHPLLIVHFQKWTRYRCQIVHFHVWPSILDRSLLIVHFERLILAQSYNFWYIRSICLSSLDQLKLNL